MRHGQGREVFASGEIEEGQFEDDEYIGTSLRVVNPRAGEGEFSSENNDING